MRTLTVAAATAALLFFCSSNSHAEDDLKWVDEEGKHLTLLAGETPVVRYMYEAIDESTPERRAETYKPYLHVFAPEGDTLLTKGPGGLFPHHRGIYYGFNKITYGDGKKCDTWHCKGNAYQSHQEIVESATDGSTATLKVVIHWHGQDAEAFASEVRTMKIMVDEAGPTVDFHSTLSTVDGNPIKLDGDPQHAGVQFRATQKVPDETKQLTYYIRPDGKGEPGKFRNWDHRNQKNAMNAKTSNLPWNALCFVVDDQRYTVVYLDSPKNPKPGRYSERDYGRFGSYFVAEVTADEPLSVNYRFVIREGELTVDECSLMHQKFVSE